MAPFIRGLKAGASTAVPLARPILRVLRVQKSCFEPGTQAQGLKPISIHFAFGTTKVLA
jgi:hypothetical protein